MARLDTRWRISQACRVTTTTDPKKDERDAIRVELFRTQAVGIVGPIPGESLGPANGEIFLAMKSAGMEGQQDPSAAPPVEAQKAPAAPPAPAAAATALKMPAAAKAAMSEALGAVIDGCAKMAEALQAAEVDDAAPVPMELVQMALSVEEALGALVEPYEEALMAAPPPPAEGEPAQKAAAPAPPPRPRMAMKRIMAMDGVSKMLTESASKLSDLVSWAKGASGMPAPALAAKGLTPAAKADLDPYTAMVATSDAVRERMYKTAGLLLESDPAAVANELRQLILMVDSLAQLVTQARSGAMAPAAPAPTPAAPAHEEVQMAAQKAFAEAASKAVTDMKADLLASLGPLVLGAKNAAAQAQAALLKVEKSVPAPQGQPAGEVPKTPADAPLPADPWRQTIEELNQARPRAAGK